MRSRSLQRTACALAIAIGILGNTPDPSRAADLSRASRLLSLDIKPQTLALALNAFALQTHQQILFTPEIVKGKTTQGVQGALTADAALSELLAGTGLVFSRSAGGMILISQADSKGVSALSHPPSPPNGATMDKRPIDEILTPIRHDRETPAAPTF